MSDRKFCQDNCEHDVDGQIWHSNQCNFYRSTKAFEVNLKCLKCEKLQKDLALAREQIDYLIEYNEKLHIKLDKKEGE